MKKTISFLILIPVIIILFSNCQSSDVSESVSTSDPYQHITDLPARELLQKAILRAGGLENWKKLQKLKFRKYFALYEASGKVENEALQTHNYTFLPENKINIRWMVDDVQHETIYQQGHVEKRIGGQPDTSANPQSLLSSVLSATFVISIPFKLLDPGVELTYAGLDTLEDNQVVEVLKAVYNPDTHEQHSTPDTWWHYFVKEDLKEIAYMVQHADHFSYVKNLRDTTVNGFVFPTKRDSYRVDSLRNISFLRARYAYSDYEVN